MGRGVFQRTIKDESGPVAEAEVLVQRAASGTPMVQLFNGRFGDEIGNPAIADENGFVRFYVEAGAYIITPRYPDGQPIGEPWTDEGISDSVYFSSEELRGGILLDIVGIWEDNESYAKGQSVSHEGYIFQSNHDENLNNEPQADPPESDEHWTFFPLAANVTGTSDTELTIGTGERLIETQAGLGWQPGTRLRVASAADHTDWMEGHIDDYAGTSLALDVDRIGGSGTFSEWNLSIAGDPGDDGTDPGLLLNFEAETSGTPNAGGVRFDEADLSAATWMRVSDVNRAGSSIAVRLLEFYSAARARDDVVTITVPETEEQVSWTVTGASDETGYVEFSIASHDGETSLPVGAISLQSERAGADGAIENVEQYWRAALNNNASSGQASDALATLGLVLATNVPDANDVAGSGWFSSATSGGDNFPDGSAWAVYQYQRTSSRKAQIAILTAGSAADGVQVRARAQVDGDVWTPWRAVGTLAESLTELFTAAPDLAASTAQIRAAMTPVNLGNSGSGTVSFDLATARRFETTINGDPTFAAPTNCQVGDDFTIFAAPNNATIRVVSWAAAFEGPHGELPEIAMGVGGAVTEIDCLVKAVSGGTATLVHAVVVGSEWGN